MKSKLLFVFCMLFATSVLLGADKNLYATETARPAWANPAVMSMKRATNLPGAQSEPNLFNNLDCNLVTYRLVASSSMQSGCFTETAYGLMDSDTGIVIFNNTDEGLPLLSHANNEVLVPWPKAMDIVVIDAVNTGGSTIALYKNPLANIQDQRNLLAQLTAKKLTTAPDLPLLDPDGNRLIINPQTLAFSDGGAWLVAETLNGAFVRINLATLDVLPFTVSYGSTGSPALLKSRVSITEDGQFVIISNDVADEFKVYDLGTCTGSIGNLRPLSCQSHDYRGFIKGQVSLKSIRHVRFINDGLISFELVGDDPAKDGIYVIAPRDSIKSLTDYIGLGDSYTSGEGAFDYLDGTDTTQNMCHLSRRSYPLLLRDDLFTSTGGHSVACSGAVINDVGSTSNKYVGQVSGGISFEDLQRSQPLLLNSIMTNYLPGYVAQGRFVGQYQPQVITVSVGGDDVGFGDILQNCVEPHLSRHASDSTCYNTYEDRQEITKLIDKTVPKWTALFKQLHRQSPQTRIYAIGYPQVIADKGSCAVNVLLSKSELEFAGSLIDYLNSAINKSAVAAGANYVDISQALVGHRLCETKSFNVAVNGLTAGKDAGAFGLNFLGKESYHPNALGQQLIEQEILRQTHNLGGPGAILPKDPTISPLLQGTKTGRATRTLTPTKNITAKLVKRGSSAKITVSGASTGLKPNTAYKVVLKKPNEQNLGSIISNGSSDINGIVTIPATSQPGGNTIDIIGPGQTDAEVDVSQPVYIPASDNDSDDDEIPDILDTCPGAPNSGQDKDQDGVDDICDPLIGLPSAQQLIDFSTVTVKAEINKVSAKLSTGTAATNKNTRVTPGFPTAKVLGSQTEMATKYTNQKLRIFNWQIWVLAIDGMILLIMLIDFGIAQYKRLFL